jgi:TFIIF-interacting CTD phosphatase-like protein
VLQVQKRPGVEAFLLEMGRRYEVVIYTDEAAMYADPVINKIDPHRAVTYRLYRGDTQVRARQFSSMLGLAVGCVASEAAE